MNRTLHTLVATVMAGSALLAVAACSGTYDNGTARAAQVSSVGESADTTGTPAASPADDTHQTSDGSGPAVAQLNIATTIAKSETTRPVQVNGYTGDLGSAEHGLTLSRDPAEAALKVLEEDPRLSKIRFTATGYSDKHPIADTKHESERVKNRRVEIVVTRG